MDALPDPDERARLMSVVAELVALDARRDALTDTERRRAADLAHTVSDGLFIRPRRP